MSAGLIYLFVDSLQLIDGRALLHPGRCQNAIGEAILPLLNYLFGGNQRHRTFSPSYGLAVLATVEVPVFVDPCCGHKDRFATGQQIPAVLVDVIMKCQGEDAAVSEVFHWVISFVPRLPIVFFKPFNQIQIVHNAHAFHPEGAIGAVIMVRIDDWLWHWQSLAFNGIFETL